MAENEAGFRLTTQVYDGTVGHRFQDVRCVGIDDSTEIRDIRLVAQPKLDRHQWKDSSVKLGVRVLGHFEVPCWLVSFRGQVV